VSELVQNYTYANYSTSAKCSTKSIISFIMGCKNWLWLIPAAIKLLEQAIAICVGIMQSE